MRRGLYEKITYNWKYKEYPGDSFVTFKLSEGRSDVKLTLSVKVVENFPEDIPEFTRESCIQGWNYFIGQNLKEYLEAKSKEDIILLAEKWKPFRSLAAYFFWHYYLRKRKRTSA